PVWQERLRGLARRFDLRRGVRVLISARVPTPTLVGWIRPVILLPLAVSSGFPVEQVELILAHELAHLRRFDHLANLFQVVLETLLFYHPVVHWISRDVRNERELCCDALALRVTGGNRREFATALVGLEEFREQHAGLTLAATGGVLLERIGQITRPGRESAMVRQPGRFVGALSALLLAGLLLSLLWRQAELRRASSDSALDIQHLASQLLPASIRMPMQTMTDLVPRHLAAPPVLAIPMPSPTASDIQPEAMQVRQPADKLLSATPPLRVADLSPARLKLASTAVPRNATPSPSPEALMPVRIVQPVYPPNALERGIEGKVVLEFSLNADGTVRDPVVVDAQPTATFDHAATQALLGWQFAPAAQPEATRRYRQIFTFTLHPDGDVAGREIQAKAGCYVVTGSHICRPGSLDEAFGTGALQ
ncbi:MAG TPA: TonB family protein, partial [Rhodanobacteraceae bacterium]|nr:TonB family protein [Rhodanobacteraceae bacterium]